MTAWLVRQEGTIKAVSVASPNDVLAGLREGTWLTTDEVKGPTDPAFVAIEAHPLFEEVAAEVAEPPVEHADETHLDMNPLIDVCLVLLIFFILTITYESLRREIDVPQTPPEQKEKPKPVDFQQIKDKVILIQVRLNGDTPVIKIQGEEVGIGELVDAVKRHMGAAPKDVVLDADEFVPWGVETAILDACKANKAPRIMYNTKRK